MTGTDGNHLAFGHDATAIADWFIERAGKDGQVMTIMKLPKMIYIAHGWYLECHGRPLIRNPIEAWQHGPVIPDLYNAYRSQGVEITQPLQSGYPALGDEDTAFLRHYQAMRKEIKDVTARKWRRSLSGCDAP